MQTIATSNHEGGQHSGAASPKPGQPAVRRVILHYHLFKNAGTSVDHMLKAHFGKRWREAEAPHRTWGPVEVAAWLQAHPGVMVLSSHTALLPVPTMPGVRIFPVIFLRNPLDRVRSVYEFERKQGAATEGSRMARQLDLKDYVLWRLSRKGDRTIRDFQVARLAPGLPRAEAAVELARAEQTLNTLPFVGIVESFDESIARLGAWLAPAFPKLPLVPKKVNVTQHRDTTIEARLAALEASLGEEVFSMLVEANKRDMVLYRAAVELAEQASERGL